MVETFNRFRDNLITTADSNIRLSEIERRRKCFRNNLFERGNRAFHRISRHSF